MNRSPRLWTFVLLLMAGCAERSTEPTDRGRRPFAEAATPTAMPTAMPTEGPSATPTPNDPPTMTPGASPTPTSGNDPAGPRVTALAPSGAISASSNQIISGLRIANPGGACITIASGVSGVVIEDSEIGPCGGSANVLVEGSDVAIRHNYIHDGHRGILASGAARVSSTRNKLSSFTGPLRTDACCVGAGADGIGSAIEYDYMDDAGTIDGNEVTGTAYVSDVVSVFRCSHLRLTNNVIDVGISYQYAAAFTIGDADGNQDPGHDNHASGNVVHSSGGVPPGVFGSSGNTVFDRNCLTSGIQAYAYNGNPFVGVTVSNSRIGPGSYVPDPSVLGGWSTNVAIGDNLAECAGL